MADDGYSASELRKRYGKGGSANDSDLSAAQLRARYAIPKNEFKGHAESNNNTTIMMIIVILALILGAGAYFMYA